MPIAAYFAAGAAVSVARHIRTKSQARKAANLYLAAHEEFTARIESLEEIQRANEAQIQYLCRMLDENEVPVSEFDLIALNYHN